MKPAWLLVLEKLRQFGVVYRAIAVLVVNVEEAVYLRRGCAGAVARAPASGQLRVKVLGERAKCETRQGAVRAERREAGTNHCARRFIVQGAIKALLCRDAGAHHTRLAYWCGGDELGDAAVELLPCDPPVAVGVPLVKQVD